MIKRLFPLLFVLAACGSGEKTPFCKCMEAGNELNEFSAEILAKSEIDKAAQTKMKELRSTKKELCKEYEMMGKAEMLELKRACTELNAEEAEVRGQDDENQEN
ncbi:MAG: hypothetical protein HRT58_11825 [Crocinitomicaceae bacterium]|nr:hypothetical protein [Flavobacteriales bacterium]NQZ36348.1 hypothetical protein [Crocinitomicaceae bacterium]